MNDDAQPDREDENESDQNAWTRLRTWTAAHRGNLVLLGFGVGAATLGIRGRGQGSVIGSAAATATAAVESAAEASERVYREFLALGSDYKKSAMDQTVDQAVRRYQRWSPEEMTVLRDASKTALAKAHELKRTFEGVMSKSIKEGLSSKAP